MHFQQIRERNRLGRKNVLDFQVQVNELEQVKEELAADLSIHCCIAGLIFLHTKKSYTSFCFFFSLSPSYSSEELDRVIQSRG